MHSFIAMLILIHCSFDLNLFSFLSIPFPLPNHQARSDPFLFRESLKFNEQHGLVGLARVLDRVMMIEPVNLCTQKEGRKGEGNQCLLCF